MTIQEKAEKLVSGMTHTVRGDKTIVIIKYGELHDTLLNITFEVSEATSLSMDSVYKFTYEALVALSENDDTDEARESIEADTYTGELTAWLAENVNNVDYLTQALKEYTHDDGYQALATAQLLAKQEVFDTVVSEIEKMDDIEV